MTGTAASSGFAERPRSAVRDGCLYLSHGPIDIIAEGTGPGMRESYRRAAARFETVLPELVSDLASLRRPASENPPVQGRIARSMVRAARLFLPVFVTPMACVAGAVADEILRVMADEGGLDRAWVNNGGDAAFFLAPGQSIDAAIGRTAGTRVRVCSDHPVRGIATSGRGGRSHSLGIADRVTVLARTAAEADAAATLIANAVDLADHPAIHRTPARDLAPDSDLGDRPVTVSVGPLDEAEIALALDRGVARARDYHQRALIVAAVLALGDTERVVGGLPDIASA